MVLTIHTDAGGANVTFVEVSKTYDWFGMPIPVRVAVLFETTMLTMLLVPDTVGKIVAVVSAVVLPKV